MENTRRNLPWIDLKSPDAGCWILYSQKDKLTSGCDLHRLLGDLDHRLFQQKGNAGDRAGSWWDRRDRLSKR